ncbi:hypothetical protein [Burkholderia sp. BCC1988]|uniref:hypothetical protein n=1 Tax=Burkholderia sp. BCC1988 TaxID=2817443 RepID=UPI002AB27AC2|nr:hypothetical protein [Burkholderia sp. BCC1988]
MNSQTQSSMAAEIKQHSRQIPSQALSTPLQTIASYPKDPLDFEDRDKDYDIDGYLYKKYEGWVLRTVSPQAGCSSVQGIFSADPPDISAKEFFTSSEIPALGIRLVTKKSNLHDIKGGKFIVKNSYLISGDAVVVLKVRGEFSYVRYVNTGPKFDGRITFGWLRSKDLVDPFPRGAQ